MTVPGRILIFFAHPVQRKSRVNRRMLAAAQRVEDVTVRELHRETKYIAAVRQRIEILNRAGQADAEDPVPQLDEVWDTPSQAREVRGERA